MVDMTHSESDYRALRHKLHQMAEPSGQEYRTHQFIMDQMTQRHPTKLITFPDNNHILAVFDSGCAGRTLLFRGDFDAVRVDETLDVPYASAMPGVAHKCGHDGHTAILLGLAETLAANLPSRGRVLLFFQAAEETGEGARQLLGTNILEKYKPDRVFALHNIPSEELGTVICREGSFTCSVISCDIHLHGHTAHAAEPLKALCPYPAAKTITDSLLALNQYDMLRDDFRLVTLVEFRIGEPAYGVAAGHGVLRFTLRSKDDALLQQTKDEVERLVTEVCGAAGLGHEIAWKEYFAASNNHPDAVQVVRRAALDCGLPYQEKKTPFSWGEDFGLLTQHYDGALFGLGSGKKQPPLHHPHFDFPDELVPVGIQLFARLCYEEE